MTRCTICDDTGLICDPVQVAFGLKYDFDIIACPYCPAGLSIPAANSDEDEF